MPVFDDESIQRLFGKEDAENEEPGRLKEYFFRNKAFENLTANLPIRILVGHKGVGKSALLRVAYSEDLENKILSLWLRPDEVRSAEPAANGADLNARIQAWKAALTRLIAREIAGWVGDQAVDRFEDRVEIDSRGRIKDLVGLVRDIVSKKFESGIDAAKKTVIDAFQRTNVIRVYLDDLDRGWEAKPDDIRNISALLNAIRDICGPRNTVQFRLGLRSDVYYLVRTSDESTDKIESNIIFLSWDNHQILTLAAKRIESYFGRSVDEFKLVTRRQNEIGRFLHSVIEPIFAGAGKWEHAPIHRVLLSLVRHRPRDLVKLMGGAAREAYRNDHQVITTGDLRSTFESYSNERLQDLVNEFRTELPAISNLLRGMRPARKEAKTSKEFLYANDQLAKKLSSLIQQNRFVFANGQRADIHSLGQFLYKIDFIMARKERDDGIIIRKYFDQNRYLQDQFVDFGFDWEVHPAYRWALQPTDIAELIRNIDLDPE